MRNRLLPFLLLPLLLVLGGCQHSAPPDDFTSGRYSGTLCQVDGDVIQLTSCFGDGYFLIEEDTNVSYYLPDNRDEPSYSSDVPIGICAEDFRPPMSLDVFYTPESGVSPLTANEIVVHPYPIGAIQVDGKMYHQLGFLVDDGQDEFSVDTAQAAGTIQNTAQFGMPPEADDQITFELMDLVGTEYYRSTGPYTGRADPMESIAVRMDHENGAWMVFKLHEDR